MTSEQWQRIERLCEAALSLDSPARTAFLDQECGGDAWLRREIESLLAADTDAGDFLESPVATAVRARPVDTITDCFTKAAEDEAAVEPRVSLGPYELVSQIGEGGMGVVYRAHDVRLGRSVAIKVLQTEFSENSLPRDWLT